MRRYVRLTPNYGIEVPVLVCGVAGDSVEILTPQGGRQWVPRHDTYPCRSYRKFMVG